MDDEKHFPPGAQPEKSAEEVATTEAEAKAAEEAAAAAEADAETKTPEEEAAAATEAEAKAKADADAAEKEEADKLPKKPRSIYDDLKEKKKEVKEAVANVEAEKARADAAETKAAELQALLDAKDDAKTPQEKKEAAKDIEEYSKKYNLDSESLEELSQIILSKAPKPDPILTPEEAAEWRAERAKGKQSAEDNQILATAPTVRKQLNINDDAELATVMQEVVKLAHTPEFHDKEVEYIIWKNQEALSKLVSPKKPSFEHGGQSADAQAEDSIDFSTGKVTPEQVGKAMTGHGTKGGIEIRKS